MNKTRKQKVKKPITKRWWFYPLIACLVIGGIGNACGDKDADKQAEEAPVAAVEEETEVIPETTTEEVEEERELGDPVGEVVFAPITYGDKKQESPVVTTDKTEVTTDNAQTTTDTTTNEQPIVDEPVEKTVYVTESGSKYHRDGCQFLKKSKIPISLSSAKSGYEPCSKCNP